MRHRRSSPEPVVDGIVNLGPQQPNRERKYRFLTVPESSDPPLNNEDKSGLPPLSPWWVALYCFAAFWPLLVASLDASHFGPGFFPLMISIFLIPSLAIVFAFDLLLRIIDAVEGKGASLKRRLGPVVVAAAGFIIYTGICVIFIVQR